MHAMIHRISNTILRQYYRGNRHSFTKLSSASASVSSNLCFGDYDYLKRSLLNASFLQEYRYQYSRSFSSESGNLDKSDNNDDNDDILNSPREKMPFDVLIVGGGPSGLAASIRLKQLCQETNVDLSVCVIEKGR